MKHRIRYKKLKRLKKRKYEICRKPIQSKEQRQQDMDQSKRGGGELMQSAKSGGEELTQLARTGGGGELMQSAESGELTQ